MERLAPRRPWIPGLTAVVVACVALACSSDGGVGPIDGAVIPIIDAPPPPEPDALRPTVCPIGDLTAPAEIEIGRLGTQLIVLEPLDEVPLTGGGQGFWVLDIGIRGRNVDGCSLTMITSLRDPCDGRLLRTTSRAITLVEAEDGWGVPKNYASYASLHGCPELTALRDSHDEPYLVEVAVDDALGQHAEASQLIIPVCPASGSEGEECACQCDSAYNIGDACPPIDAGGPAPTCLDAGPPS